METSPQAGKGVEACAEAWPLARVSMTRNDLGTAEDTTPAHAEACRALWDNVQFRNDGPYTRWNYRP